MKISIQHKGRTLTKNTKRSDVSHVVVCLHNGEYKICGLHKSHEHAVKDVESICNPAFTDATIVALAQQEKIESGLTGEDWEPTKSTKYYAQLGNKFAFGSSEEQAIKNLKNIL